MVKEKKINNNSNNIYIDINNSSSLIDNNNFNLYKFNFFTLIAFKCSFKIIFKINARSIIHSKLIILLVTKVNPPKLNDKIYTFSTKKKKVHNAIAIVI